MVPEQSSAEEQQPSVAARSHLWPVLIVALLVVHAVSMLVMVYVAVSDRSFAVEPDYYGKSMRWDEMRAAQRASDQLGWQATLTVGVRADIYRNREIQCVLSDRDGQPVAGAVVEIVAFSRARGQTRHALTLDPGPQGQYHGPLQVERDGNWEFRITVRRGAEVFTETKLVQVAPAAGESR